MTGAKVGRHITSINTKKDQNATKSYLFSDYDVKLALIFRFQCQFGIQSGFFTDFSGSFTKFFFTKFVEVGLGGKSIGNKYLFY